MVTPPALPHDWTRVTQLVGQALERPADERGAWLADACGGDDALRREVEPSLQPTQTRAGF